MKTRVLFLGRKNYSAGLLEWFLENGFEVVGVVTDEHVSGSPTAVTAKELGLRIFNFDDAIRATLAGELHFDLGVCYVYWKKLPIELTSHPQFGFINFHPAPLPHLKGTGGYNIAILEAHSRYGVTAHYMDASIDTGPIIEVRWFDINSHEHTAASLERLSHSVMVELAKDLLSRVRVEKILPSNYQSGGRYISRSEMESLKLIVPGDDVDKKIRAFWYPPYDGAIIEIGGKYYTVINRDILEYCAGDDIPIFLSSQIT